MILAKTCGNGLSRLVSRPKGRITGWLIANAESRKRRTLSGVDGDGKSSAIADVLCERVSGCFKAGY